MLSVLIPYQRYLCTATPRHLQQPHQLHSSRSHEPLSHRNHDTSLAFNQSLSPSSNSRSQSPPPPPPPASAPTTTFPSTPSKSQRPSPTPLIVPQRSESLSMPASASTSTPEEQSATTAHPLSNTRPLQYRKGSIAESVSSVTSGTNLNTATPATTTSHGHHNSSMYTPTQGQPRHDAQTAPPMSSIQITMSPATPQTSSLQTQAQNNTLSAIPETRPLFSAVDTRSSRITLPDEARQYIVNMVDSPVPSPQVDAFTTSKPKVSSNLVPQQQSESAGQNAEFLDLGDDESDESEGEELDGDETDFGSVQEKSKSTESGTQESTSALTNISATTPSEQQPHAHLPMFVNPFADTAQTQGQGQVPGQERGQTWGVPEETPYPSTTTLPQWQASDTAFDQTAKLGHVPPGTHQPLINNPAVSSVPQSQPQPQPHHQPHTQPEAQHQTQQNQYQHQIQQQPQQLMSSEQLNYSTGSPPPSHPPQHQAHPAALIPPRIDSRPSERQQPESFMSSTTTTITSSTLASMESIPRRDRDHDQYRALPLLSSDLPTTAVTVTHSHVRPNDRGKEVLSFVIVVNPGNGKEPWKVEKMYSDVVGLDSRVRASVGKSIGKRIVNLPEGKLWRDHAPAKVDQRKVCIGFFDKFASY